MFKLRSIFYLLFFFLFFQACSSRPQPKNTVKNFIFAIEKTDKAAMEQVLDIEKILQERKNDLISQGREKETLGVTKDFLLQDLTSQGKTGQKWISSQIVIGQTEIMGDSALVEVSFIDKKTSIQYYNKFGLYYKDGAWKIYAFRMLR